MIIQRAPELVVGVKVTGFLLVAVLALLAMPVSATQPTLVLNPYAGIDWTQTPQFKGNLHTHTTESDGSYEPAAVIDMYREHGYDILALTDHDRCTWPWDKFGRDPEALAMTAIPGNELSRHHHALSLFCTYETKETDMDGALAGVADADGISVLCHPAMHWEPDLTEATRLRRLLDPDARPQQVPESAIAMYVALFKRHSHLIATEISNASEPLYRYPLDRELWDHLLTALMPGRPVWGVNTDDMHSMDHFGSDFVIFLTQQREPHHLRAALVNGSFYFSTRRVPETASEHDTDPPRIVSILHHEDGHVLEVTAREEDAPLSDDAYAWISNGEVVAAGPRLAYRAVDGLGPYARLEITGKGGTTFTNPFGFSVP